MRLLLLACSVALATATGCSSCAKASPGPPAEASVSTPPPVAEPPGLLAQVWVRAPDALWARIQNGVSGAAALMPSDAGSLLCAATGLDAAVGPLVDGKAGAFVVVAGAPAGSGLGWAAAVPLKDGARVASILLPADAGPARTSARDDQGMRVLSREGHALTPAVALAQGWLVVASSEADLSRLGPYAYRTMPAVAAPAQRSSVVAVLSQEALGARVAAGWDQARAWLSARDREQRERHGGRAPDFGDPQAILDAADVVVKRRIALLSDARAATLELEAGDDDLRADLRLDPGPAEGGASLAAMTPGDARPLADVPADAALALLVRDGATSRADDARELETALASALGPRERDDDRKAVAKAIDAWAASRGDWLTASLSWGSPRAVTLQSPGGDDAARALRGLVDLAGRPAFAGLLRATFDLGPPSLVPAHVDGWTDASLATFGARSALGVAWGVRSDRLVAVAAEHADQRLSGQPGELGDDPRVARALGALGSDVTLVLLSEPLRLDAGRAASAAAHSPALLAWGRRDGGAWLRVDVGDELLREVVRLQTGL